MALSGWAPGLAECARCGAPGPHDTFVAQLGGMVCRRLRPGGRRTRRRRRRRTCCRRSWRATGRRGCRVTAPTRGPPRASSPPTRSGTSSAASARSSTSGRRRPMSPKPYTHRDAVPYRPARLDRPVPAGLPEGQRAGARRDRHGRQRPLGEPARAHAHRGSPAGEAALLDVVAGAIQAGVKHLSRLRVLDRELDALARRGALPHGLQPRRAAPPPRPAQRVGRARALVGTQAAPVGDRHQGAAVRRAAHRRQRRAHAHDVRQLRRARRARRRDARDRRRHRGRAAEAVGGHREAHPEAPLPARHARRRPVRPLQRRAAHVELPAVGVGVRRVRLPRHALAGLLAHRSVAGDRHCYLDRDRRFGGAVDTPSPALDELPVRTRYPPEYVPRHARGCRLA